MSTADTKTTKDKVKEMFQSGQILTSCGAAKDFLTADLRRIITTLKKEGMDIVDRWATSTTSKRYKEYFLREFTPKAPVTAVVEAPPILAPEPAPIAPDPIIPGPSRVEVELLQQAQHENMAGKQQKLF